MRRDGKELGPSPNPGGRPKRRLLSQALSSRFAEIKSDDPEGRTEGEVVAANLIEIACSRGPGAVTAANEIADRLEGRPTQELERQRCGVRSPHPQRCGIGVPSTP
jgi:hypothetical protein